MILISLILTLNLTLLFLFRILINNKLDLLTLRDTLLILNQPKSLFKLHCIFDFRSVINLSGKNKLLLSVNNKGLHELDMFIYYL